MRVEPEVYDKLNLLYLYLSPPETDAALLEVEVSSFEKFLLYAKELRAWSSYYASLDVAIENACVGH